MNPVFKILNNLIIAINRLIDSMNLRTVQSIKRGFLFLTFLMCLVGLYIGYSMGTKSAKIKSPPLAEFVNDTFATDINRERDTGSFSGVLESEMVRESDTINSNKVDFFVRERLNTETDNSVIDSGKSVSDPFLGEKVYRPETPVNDDARFNRTDDSRINVLDREISTPGNKDVIIQESKESNTTGTGSTDDKKTDIRLLEKDRAFKPATIQKDQGTPEQ